MNSTTFENNSSFNYLFENKFPKILSVSIISSMVLFGGPVYYAIIWYERFGTNMKRTLINQVTPKTLGFLNFLNGNYQISS
jgi:hypothetical protein